MPRSRSLMPLFVFVFTAWPVVAATYTVTDLGWNGTGPGGGTFGAHINNKGQVAGSGSYNVYGVAHGFFYDGHSTTDIGSLGGYPTQIYGISDSGQIVGFSVNSAGVSRAFLYTGGVIKDLGTLGGAGATASGINNRGQVVGGADTATGNGHAFLYTPGTGMTDLHPLIGGTSSFASSINDTGQIAGYYAAANGYNHAFILNGSTLTDVGVLLNGGATNTYPVRINNSGQMIIVSDLGPFFYNAGSMTAIPGFNANVTGMNNGGQIVGESNYCCDGLLYDHGSITNLNSLGVGVPAMVAQDINDSGQIVVWGLEMYLLTPIASPYAQSASLGQPGGSSRNSSPWSAEPVNTATGDYYTTMTDLAVPGKGLSFVFARSYNSLDSYAGPLGPGWTHSFNLLLSQHSDGTVSIKEADGGSITFSPLGGGSYSALTPGVFDTLVQNADSSFTLTRKNQTRLNFSSAGRLTSIVDRNGNGQNVVYDGSGHLTSVTDSSSRVFSLAYNAEGLLVSLSDPTGRTVRYTYDASGRLTTAIDAAGNSTAYAYDSNNRLLSATDARGNVYLRNTYDAQGRVVTQQNARNFTTTFAYDSPAPHTTTITDPLGNVTEQVTDSAFRFIEQIDAAGGMTFYTYFGNNLKASTTDPLGRTQSFGYDGNGNLTSLTDAAGKTSSFTYDSKNNLLTSTDRLGRTTTFTYDPTGDLLTTLDPLHNTSTLTYDSQGEVVTATNARGFTTSFQYDSSGDLTKVTDPLGGTVALGYDGIGRLLSVQNQLGKTATRAYDPDNRLLSVTDPLGNMTQFAYDGNGNLTRITDANAKQTQYGYDPTNKLAQVTDAIGGITQYQYNGNTDLTTVTDANGHSTTYAYDALRRMSTVTDPLGRQRRYAYDGANNVTSTADGNNKTNAFGYDPLNRLVSMSLSDGKNVSLSYDAVGNRVTMTDWRGTSSYAYDLLNRVTSIATPDGKTVGYTYDAIGDRATLHYPDGKVVQYTYDAMNRLAKVTDWTGKSTTYSYDGVGNLTGFAHPNGATTAYQYDAANRLTNVTNRSGASTLSSFSYVLDNIGNRLQMTTSAGGINHYGYDALYRLISWSPPSGQPTQWTYDFVGNRLLMVSAAGITRYTYDAADELLTAGATTYTYDGNGNQITKTAGSTVTKLGWDALNRLVSVVGGTVNTQYQYDGDGNRISQQIPTGTYAYVNDPAVSLPVVLSETGPDGNITYNYGLAMISVTSSTTQYYHQFDGLGSASNLTDASGAQKANYSYDPWGKLTLPLDPVGTKDKYKFTDEAVDPNSALTYLRSRFYDVSTGRFISRDPLQSRSIYGESMYSYVADSPTQLTDHSGLWYSWSQIRQAFGDTIQTLPSFALCGGGVFDIASSCQQQGLSKEQVAIGSDIGTMFLAVTTGGTGLAVKGVVNDLTEAGQLVYKGLHNQLTPDDLLNASEDVLLTRYGIDVPDTGKYLVNDILLPFALSGPPSSNSVYPSVSLSIGQFYQLTGQRAK